METPPFGDPKIAYLGLKESSSVLFHAGEAWDSWKRGHRIFLGVACAIYIVVAAASESLISVIVGGVLLLVWRLWAIEKIVQYRSILLGDLLIELHNYHHSSLTEIEQAIWKTRK